MRSCRKPHLGSTILAHPLESTRPHAKHDFAPRTLVRVGNGCHRIFW
jgi:hypothetical protein